LNIPASRPPNNPKHRPRQQSPTIICC